MSTIFKVKRAQESEHAALIALWRDLYQWHYEQCSRFIKKPCVNELEAELNNYLNTPDCVVFVAVSNGVVCGFVTGQLYEMATPLTQAALIGSIDHWYVSEIYRGQGIGKSLLDRIEQEFDDYGAQRVHVEVWSFNKNALEAYQRKGFQTHIHCMTKTLNG